MKKKRDLGLAKLKHEFKYVDGKPVITPILTPSDARAAKAMKNYKKRSATIEMNGIPFDADTESISFMGSVLALANFKVNEAVRGGVAYNDAYDAVYTQTIPWKDANGNWQEIVIGEISIGLEAAMRNIATLAG